VELFFGPSSVTVSRIHGMIDNSYFAEGMGRELEEEIVPEPNPDEAVIFDEFFTAGMRIPLHPVLSGMLLKFQVRIHQFTPMPSFNCQSTSGQWRTSGAFHQLKASQRGMSSTINQGRLRLMGLRYCRNIVAAIVTPRCHSPLPLKKSHPKILKGERL
jgi:hypothetical protein